MTDETTVPQPPAPVAGQAPQHAQQPQYGQYAPGMQNPPQPAGQYPAGQYPAGQYAPYDPAGQQAPPRRRTWDLVLTISLLAVGFFGAGYGVITGLTYEQSVVVGMQMQGMDDLWTPPPWLGAAGAFVAISHVLLYIAALAVGIPLLLRKRIAFWAPLGAGVLAAIIFHGTSFIVGAVGAIPASLVP